MKGLRIYLPIAVLLFAVSVAIAEDIPERTPLGEAELIAVLQGNADWAEKQAACRDLRRVGTAKAVPALASLLGDEKLSHMGRFALETIPGEEASAALREAVGNTSGLQKMGVMSSIGVRRDAKAVAVLSPVLKDSDPEVAAVAAASLGRIGTVESAEVLLGAAGAVTDTLRPALAEGLLAAGHHLVREGEAKVAAGIYRELNGAQWPEFARLGAFHGMAYAEPAETPARLIGVLGSDDVLFRDFAATIIGETSGADATRAYATALPNLPVPGQLALLRGLATRGDPLAHAAIVEAISSGDKRVQAAALRALGKLGGPADISRLSTLLVSDDEAIAQAAKDTLIQLPGAEVDAAIARAVAVVSAGERAQLLELLVSRLAAEAVPVAASYLNDEDAAVRAEALTTMMHLGEKDQTEAVLAALEGDGDASVRETAAEALSAICKRSGDEVLPAVVAALGSGKEETRVAILEALSEIGTATALESVLAARADKSEAVRDEALRVLTTWSGKAAAPHLLALAKSADVKERMLGMRGYVRLARAESSPEEKGAMLSAITALAEKQEEKWLVLSAWGTLGTKQSLDTLIPYLEDADAKGEAAVAIIAVAAELGKGDANAKQAAIAALNLLTPSNPDQGIRESAQRTLEQIK